MQRDRRGRRAHHQREGRRGGAAEFDEFKSDFSLSARRAAADMATKLAQEVRKNDKLR
ncbi:hypothetical protein OOT46_24220 [Aquabacterium sp. A7-Y]|uniref:hypothetical protein n=1 Tax=Aquabacterium sp. A7-Y TaxID=1349605 RepID=UPI00223C94FD|nr:hypothetical protein [Aquabacterium sp. A7-Y]MCW7540931.1 hypothetical protein [Aquabacterium sp. A7-Y]